MREASKYACALFALGITACRVFDASLVEDASRSDAGTSLDGGADADAAPACELERPPPRPEVADDPDEDVGEVVFVLHDVTLNQEDERWRTIGFDLDGLCSEPPDPVVECRAPSPSAPPEIDGERGIDNALGHYVLSLVLFAFPELEVGFSGQMNGFGSMLLRIRDWNGRDDDSRVNVTFAQTIYGSPALPDGGAPAPLPDPPGDAWPPPSPRWDGQDWFWARATSFLDGNPERPLIADDNAYVSDRVLVLRLPERLPIVFSGEDRSIRVHLTDATIAARISDDAARLDWARMGGRWPTLELLATIPSTGICPGTEDYERMRRVTDLAADVRERPGSGGPDVVCDAISIGLNADGVRARIGGLTTLFNALPNRCELLASDAGMPDGG